MKKLILFLLLFVGLGMTTNTQAQDYKSAIGLRLGYPISITYKTFLNETNAIEIFGGFRSYNQYTTVNVTAGYLLHNDFPDVERLKWYYGLGGGVAFYNFDNDFVVDDDGLSIVINGFLGLDYTLKDTPINLSVDWIPGIFIGGYGSGFGAGRGALSVRYILGGASF